MKYIWTKTENIINEDIYRNTWMSEEHCSTRRTWPRCSKRAATRCPAASPEDADAIIVNTCAFINDAKTESIDTILEMAQYKQDQETGGKQDKLLVVSGCLAQRYSEELYREIPEADILIGVNDYDHINEILSEHDTKGRCSRYDTAAPQSYCEIPDRLTEAGSVSAYLRIAEGCDNVCSYCVIPSIRGHYRSRHMEDIQAEAEMLAARGTKELIIIAQDVTAYRKGVHTGCRSRAA